MIIQTNGNAIAFSAIGILIAMIVAWFFMLARLFAHLSKDHPAKYEAMGRPGLFWRSNISNQLAATKFLFLREHRALGDSKLSKLSDRMLLFLAVYIIFFIWVIHYINAFPRHVA